MESTSPKSEQDSGILDVEDEEDDEEVSNLQVGEMKYFFSSVFYVWNVLIHIIALWLLQD